MAWVYKIQSIRTETKTGETYVLVHFWEIRSDFLSAKPPTIIEDFIMQLRATSKEMVTDPEGRVLRESGVFATIHAPTDPDDPPVYTTELLDVKAELHGNIQRFMKANRPIKGDLTSITKTDTSDPHNILTKVISLEGKDFDEPNVIEVIA